MGARTDPISATEAPSVDALRERLASGSRVSVELLQSDWQQCRNLSRCPPDVHLALGEQILKRGEPILGYDILSRGLGVLDTQGNRTPAENELRLRLMQQSALALAQSGAAARAGHLLAQLCEEGQDTPETLGLLGRVHKDLARKASTEVERREQLREALCHYRQGFEQSDSLYKASRAAKIAEAAYYCGINAAAVHVLLGDLPTARVIAARVREICEAQLPPAGRGRAPANYWLLATLGEAELICGKREAARLWYRAAVKAGRGNWRELSSTRRQARLLINCLGQETAPWEALFRKESVVVFGSSDWDGAAAIATADRAAEIRRALSRRMTELGVIAGYIGAVSPADLLFGEALVRRGAEAHIVLPYDRELCRQVFAAHPGWQRRFDALLSRATSITEDAERSCLDESVNLRFAGLRAYGLGWLRARRLDVELHRWGVEARPASAARKGFLLRHWNRLGCSWELVGGELSLVVCGRRKRASRPPRSMLLAPGAHEILAMLFADIKGYSRLNDVALFRFNQAFVPALARLLAPFRERILARRTSGDGIFLVLPDVEAAADVAFALRDMVARTAWDKAGLPAHLGIRISLDAGPVYTVGDAMTDQPDVCGTYVNRAARIEPITPPNEVYASETFTSLYVAAGGEAFTFDYVGQTQLPKGFGLAPLYCLNQNRAP